MVVDRRRKAMLQVGSKSLELVDGGEGDHLRYGLVERGSGVRRGIWVSEIEFIWLCLIFEDASSEYGKEFLRSYRGFMRKVKVRRLVLERGFILRVEVRVSGRAWHVLVPELCGNGGWVDISKKFWAFCGRSCSEGRVDGRSFLEVANIGEWPENTVAVGEKGEKRRGCDVDVRDDSTQKMMRFLERCLVGRMEKGGLALPAAMEVQRWAQKTWKVTAGVQVLELRGCLFLFLLPSFEEAQRVLQGDWIFKGRRLDLEWWSPVGCCVKPGDASSEVWVKILGLPLQFWDFEVFREIGNHCGGFLFVDEETRQRTHLQWARIAVRAPPENVPATVKIATGSWLFKVTLWVEKGPKVVFLPSLEVNLDRQEMSPEVQ
ncbi:hypothetical protein RHMOL_Rhmol07G0221100 [Rhododendron molle]|uniref:Uncharacterized protein n=1 Tax=Rhododendron molle TaxID=49168 RepID=A0ACC0N527_RHOML|nr:hypothetical protein RHMOL_Rhmol07G0221100 [Rhododendron molle]